MIRFMNKYRSFLAFTGLIVAGLILHLWPSEWRMHSTIHVLSDALIVASILGLTVDTFLKYDLMRDVGSIFIGWALPDEIRNYIREISQTSLVRRNYRAAYVVTKVNDRVVVNATAEWELYNYSSGTRTYRPHMAINNNEEPSLDAIQCTLSFRGKDRLFKADELNSKYVEKENTRVVYRLPGRKLRYQDIEDRRTTPECRVKWHYRIVKNLTDTIINYSTLPTIGATVTIQCDCGLNFEFEPEFSHADGSGEWHSDSLFMPMQVFSIRWHPEKELEKSANPATQS